MFVPAPKTILGFLLATSLAFAAPSAHATPTHVTVTTTFSYTGAEQMYTVPAGVNKVQVKAVGAPGGHGHSGTVIGAGGVGGKGASVTSVLNVSPGQILYVEVGGVGGDGHGNPNGGFNGGGAGGSVALGGGGGGASDVRLVSCGMPCDLLSPASLISRFVVAGGGGGGGAGYSDLAGGAGGGVQALQAYLGAFGQAGQGGSCAGGGGAGGGTLSGGSGGPGGANACDPQIFGTKGGDGGFGYGGEGGGHQDYGGGGGGGYYGGGGGGGGADGGGGGGGGGSSFGPSGSIYAQDATGIPMVEITTLVIAVTFASASATQTAKGVLVRWRTGTEADLLGFLVYRSRGHAWRRLTRALIAAKGSVSGASYRFLDRTGARGVQYRYRIKAVNVDGTASWYGPVSVT